MNSKQMKPRHKGAVPPQGGQFHTRKEENAHPHDEADLVNFRADAYSRFTTNQDYMENVTLKPFHTAKIVPPFSFPTHSKKKYEEGASDAEVAEVLKNMAPKENYTGDVRLMRAKEQANAKELAALRLELAALSAENVFSEETRFQKDAVGKLARLLAECNSAEALAKLESAVEEISGENERRFGKNYVLQHQPYQKRSVPIKELAPDVEVHEAPPLYNPRLIMSFIDMNRGDENGFRDEMLDADKLDFNGAEEFLMVGNGSKLSLPSRNGPTPAFNGTPQEAMPANGPGAYNGMEKANDEVNMDELNQFLAELHNNEGMDDMDALMNFDQDNDAGLIEDDGFGVEFLNMDNAME